MEFSLPTLFVLPASNTLPTTGSTNSLTAGNLGFYGPDFVAATAGNIGADPYFYVAQGPRTTLPEVRTRISDKIFKNKIISFYRKQAVSTATNQIIEISDFNATCGEDVTISVRLKSFYLDVAYFNGLTTSWTITTPCCECGEDPCTQVDAEALVDAFVAKINADNGFNSAGRYITASKDEDADDNPILVLTGNTLPAEPVTCDPTNFQFQQDRLYFWAFAYKGPETSQDFNVWDACDPFATVETIQHSTYIQGSSAEVKLVEMQNYSYNRHPIFQKIYRNVNYNQGYISEVIDGTFYDLYYVKFENPAPLHWNPSVPQDETVIIANPVGQNSGTIAVLTAALGTPVEA